MLFQGHLGHQLLPVSEALNIPLHAAVQALLLLKVLSYQVTVLHGCSTVLSICAI